MRRAIWAPRERGNWPGWRAQRRAARVLVRDGTRWSGGARATGVLFAAPLSRAGGCVALVLCLWGCGTPSVLMDPSAEQRRIGPDVFHVLVEGDSATVANFSTGMNLMLRVEEGARAAVEEVSGCEVVRMVKFDAINRWQARLRCPPG